jgi:hypothetical protein
MEGQKLLTAAIKTAQESQAKATDPGEHTKQVIEMAKLMTAPPVATGPSLADIMGLVTAMMAPMVEAHKAILEESRARAAAAEKRAELLEQRLMPPAVAVPLTVAPEVGNPVKNAIDLLKGLASLKDTAGSLLTETAADQDMPVWARLTSKFLDAAPGMLHNAAVLKTGAGQPVPPEDLNPALIEAENPQPQAAAEPKQEDDGVISEKRIAQEIAGPLVKALNDGNRGFEFAAGMMSQPRIMGFPGRVVYEMAVEQGEQGMMRICQADPALWRLLVQIPTQFQRFVTEFLDRDAAYGVLAQAKAAASAPPPPVAPVAPVQTNGTPEPVKLVTPTVMPAGRGKGRTILNPADGKPVHTAPIVDLPPAS